MTVDELFRLPGIRGVDRWLFDGRLVERRNPNRFHSPLHASTLSKISASLCEWARSAKAQGFQPYGYGCPYLLAREPDTLVSFDASLAASAEADQEDLYVVGAPVFAVEIAEMGEEPGPFEQLVRAALNHGVQHMWVIDPVEHTVTTHSRSRQVTFDDGELDVSFAAHLPPFRCRVAEIFE